MPNAVPMPGSLQLRLQLRCKQALAVRGLSGASSVWKGEGGGVTAAVTAATLRMSQTSMFRVDCPAAAPGLRAGPCRRTL